MSTDPIRIALERLVEELNEYDPKFDAFPEEALTAARAALDAAPPDEPPAWRGLISRMADELDHCRQLVADDRREVHPLAEEARAALDDTPPAPAAGEVGELVAWLREESQIADRDDCPIASDKLYRAAALLEQLSAAQAPQPVAVSERLPQPEDCDAEGKCWFFDPCEHGWWWLRSAIFIPDSLTHWLPADALPHPTTTPAGQEGA